MNYETKLSDIIASLADIEGGFLYSGKNGVSTDLSAGITDTAGLTRMGEKFSQINTLLTEHYNDTSHLRLTFKDLVVYAMQLPESQWLFLLCRPGLSHTMLNMTVQLALNVESGEEYQAVQARESSDAPLLSPEQDEIPNNDLLESLLQPASRLSKPLIALKDALAESIGPVAELVFEDSVRKWGELETPTRENILDFNDLLLLEVDSEADRDTLTEITKTFLKEA